MLVRAYLVPATPHNLARLLQCPERVLVGSFDVTLVLGNARDLVSLMNGEETVVGNLSSVLCNFSILGGVGSVSDGVTGDSTRRDVLNVLSKVMVNVTSFDEEVSQANELEEGRYSHDASDCKRLVKRDDWILDVVFSQRRGEC